MERRPYCFVVFMPKFKLFLYKKPLTKMRLSVSLTPTLSQREGGQNKSLPTTQKCEASETFCARQEQREARGVGFLREGGDQDPPSLKPPLEVLETFGGAKVSDKRPAINGMRKPSTNSKGN
jgi:hypothetical protein